MSTSTSINYEISLPSTSSACNGTFSSSTALKNSDTSKKLNLVNYRKQIRKRRNNSRKTKKWKKLNLRKSANIDDEIDLNKVIYSCSYQYYSDEKLKSIQEVLKKETQTKPIQSNDSNELHSISVIDGFRINCFEDEKQFEFHSKIQSLCYIEFLIRRKEEEKRKNQEAQVTYDDLGPPIKRQAKPKDSISVESAASPTLKFEPELNEHSYAIVENDNTANDSNCDENNDLLSSTPPSSVLAKKSSRGRLIKPKTSYQDDDWLQSDVDWAQFDRTINSIRKEKPKNRSHTEVSYRNEQSGQNSTLEPEPPSYSQKDSLLDSTPITIECTPAVDLIKFNGSSLRSAPSSSGSSLLSKPSPKLSNCRSILAQPSSSKPVSSAGLKSSKPQLVQKIRTYIHYNGKCYIILTPEQPNAQGIVNPLQNDQTLLNKLEVDEKSTINKTKSNDIKFGDDSIPEQNHDDSNNENSTQNINENKTILTIPNELILTQVFSRYTPYGWKAFMIPEKSNTIYEINSDDMGPDHTYCVDIESMEKIKRSALISARKAKFRFDTLPFLKKLTRAHNEFDFYDADYPFLVNIMKQGDDNDSGNVAEHFVNILGRFYDQKYKTYYERRNKLEKPKKQRKEILLDAIDKQRRLLFIDVERRPKPPVPNASPPLPCPPPPPSVPVSKRLPIQLTSIITENVGKKFLVCVPAPENGAGTSGAINVVTSVSGTTNVNSNTKFNDIPSGGTTVATDGNSAEKFKSFDKQIRVVTKTGNPAVSTLLNNSGTSKPFFYQLRPANPIMVSSKTSTFQSNAKIATTTPTTPSKKIPAIFIEKSQNQTAFLSPTLVASNLSKYNVVPSKPSRSPNLHQQTPATPLSHSGMIFYQFPSPTLSTSASTSTSTSTSTSILQPISTLRKINIRPINSAASTGVSPTQSVLNSTTTNIQLKRPLEPSTSSGVPPNLSILNTTTPNQLKSLLSPKSSSPGVSPTQSILNTTTTTTNKLKSLLQPASSSTSTSVSPTQSITNVITTNIYSKRPLEPSSSTPSGQAPTQSVLNTTTTTNRLKSLLETPPPRSSLGVSPTQSVLNTTTTTNKLKKPLEQPPSSSGVLPTQSVLNGPGPNIQLTRLLPLESSSGVLPTQSVLNGPSPNIQLTRLLPPESSSGVSPTQSVLNGPGPNSQLKKLLSPEYSSAARPTQSILNGTAPNSQLERLLLSESSPVTVKEEIDEEEIIFMGEFIPNKKRKNNDNNMTIRRNGVARTLMTTTVPRNKSVDEQNDVIGIQTTTTWMPQSNAITSPEFSNITNETNRNSSAVDDGVENPNNSEFNDLDLD